MTKHRLKDHFTNILRKVIYIVQYEIGKIDINNFEVKRKHRIRAGRNYIT